MNCGCVCIHNLLGIYKVCVRDCPICWDTKINMIDAAPLS